MSPLECSEDTYDGFCIMYYMSSLDFVFVNIIIIIIDLKWLIRDKFVLFLLYFLMHFCSRHEDKRFITRLLMVLYIKN